MKDKKIAVVIVSFNGRQYLIDCFSSLEKQTKKPAEIIVVDNCSSDGTQAYLNRFLLMSQLKIKLILNKKNQNLKLILKIKTWNNFFTNKTSKI